MKPIESRAEALGFGEQYQHGGYNHGLQGKRLDDGTEL